MEGNLSKRIRHDLKTYLHQMLGYTELLQEDAEEYQETEISQFLKEISLDLEEAVKMIQEGLGNVLQKRDMPTLKDFQSRLSSLILKILEKTQQIKQKFSFKKISLQLSDLEKISAAGNKILDLLEEMQRIVPFKIETDSKLEDLPSIDLDQGTNLKINESGKSSAVSGGRILVLDDEESNRDILSRQLTRQGHTVFTSHNGTEALDILQQEEIDLILLDLMLPGMSGFEFLEKIKAIKSYQNIPVIIISMYNDVENVIHSIQLGADDFLPKGSNPVLLKAKVDGLLEKKQLHDQEVLYLAQILEGQATLAQELAEAAKYVTGLLPPPCEKPISIDWIFIPCEKLGGDCFGYHFLDDQTLAIYLLDVSGHGIGAALLSVSVLNVLRSQSLYHTDFSKPADVLNELNKVFRMETQNNMYFSIWYGVFSLKDNTIRYSCGGAPPALLVSEEDNNQVKITELNSPGCVIGVTEEIFYQEKSCQVPPKSRLYLFSDGVYDVKMPNGKILGNEELNRIISAQDHSQNSTVQGVLNLIRARSGQDHFPDDFSLLEAGLTLQSNKKPE